jgi:hypothetical protein
MMKIFPALIICCIAWLDLAAQPQQLMSKTYYAFSDGAVLYRDSTRYGYNEEGQLSSLSYFEKNGNSPWQPERRKIDYEYDFHGNLLTYTLQLWEGLEGWVNRARYKYTYNTGHQETAILIEQWGDEKWSPFVTVWKEYDDRGRLIREILPYSIFANFYGADGLLASREIYHKDNNQTWYNKQIFRYLYVPGTDLLAATYTDVWSPAGWVEGVREVQQHDDEGLWKVITRERWNGSLWERQLKDSLVFDEFQNQVLWSISEWIDTTWYEYFQIHYQYNEFNNIVSERLLSKNGPEWKMSGFIRYLYSTLVPVHEPAQSSLDVFPNPASGVVTLHTDELLKVALFDAQGRLVESRILAPYLDHSVPVAHLAPGIYYLRVTSEDNNTHVKPLIIQH